MSSVAGKGNGEIIRILDARGCLTTEAICFVDDLGPDQRAVVERHVRSCTICAQQRTSLANAAQRIRSARPRVTVPADARTAARRAILRCLLLRRQRPADHDAVIVEPPPQALPSRQRCWVGLLLAAGLLLGAGLAVGLSW